MNGVRHLQVITGPEGSADCYKRELVIWSEPMLAQIRHSLATAKGKSRYDLCDEESALHTCPELWNTHHSARSSSHGENIEKVPAFVKRISSDREKLIYRRDDPLFFENVRPVIGRGKFHPPHRSEGGEPPSMASPPRTRACSLPIAGFYLRSSILVASRRPPEVSIEM